MKKMDQMTTLVAEVQLICLDQHHQILQASSLTWNPIDDNVIFIKYIEDLHESIKKKIETHIITMMINSQRLLFVKFVKNWLDSKM